MATSLDGLTRGASGTSVDISSPEDRDLLLMLRACADAILVGASTVRAYPYRPPSAHPRWQEMRANFRMSPAPRLVVVTARGIPADNPCFSDPANLPMVIASATCTNSAVAAMRATGAQVVTASDAEVDMNELLAMLQAEGMSRVVCEGGPGLLSQLSHAGVIDELCVSTSPVWLGGGDLHLTGPHASPLVTHFTIARILVSRQGSLFTQWQR